MYDLYENLKNTMETEIDKIVKRGNIDQNDLCNLDKLVDIVKDIKELESMSDSGYSGRGYGNFYWGDSPNRHYNGNYSGRYYNDGLSNNPMMFDNNNQYSGMNNPQNYGNKEHMASLLKEAMQYSNNEEREQISRMLNNMNMNK